MCVNYVSNFATDCLLFDYSSVSVCDYSYIDSGMLEFAGGCFKILVCEKRTACGSEIASWR